MNALRRNYETKRRVLFTEEREGPDDSTREYYFLVGPNRGSVLKTASFTTLRKGCLTFRFRRQYNGPNCSFTVLLDR